MLFPQYIFTEITPIKDTSEFYTGKQLCLTEKKQPGTSCVTFFYGFFLFYLMLFPPYFFTEITPIEDMSESFESELSKGMLTYFVYLKHCIY